MKAPAHGIVLRCLAPPYSPRPDHCKPKLFTGAPEGLNPSPSGRLEPLGKRRKEFGEAEGPERAERVGTSESAFGCGRTAPTHGECPTAATPKLFSLTQSLSQSLSLRERVAAHGKGGWTAIPVRVESPHGCRTFFRARPRPAGEYLSGDFVHAHKSKAKRLKL